MRLYRQFPRRVIAATSRRLRSAIRCIRPAYTRFAHGPLTLRDHGSNPRRILALSSTRFVCPPDFLPDRASFSGELFQSSPHVEFARAYLAAGDRFDFTVTRYYRLARVGRLPVPVKGATKATVRAQEFIWLIDWIRARGEMPGRIVVSECDDGSFAVLDGKHRLAALLALGAAEVEVSLSFADEMRELYRPAAALAWPRRAYRKTHELIARLGAPISDRASVDGLISRIRSAKLETWADIYHPLPFIEFGGLSTQITAATPYARLGMILEEHDSLCGSKVLDLGCNLGFYSFSLARRGAQVTGVEIRDDYHQISIDLARLYRVPVSFVRDGVSPELVESLGSQDITLCFSTLQWVIAQCGFDRGMQTLDAISRNSRVLYFDVPVNVGAACLRCPPGQEISFVERLLRENTQYASVKRVGYVHPYGSDIRHVFRCEDRKAAIQEA